MPFILAIEGGEALLAGAAVEGTEAVAAAGAGEAAAGAGAAGAAGGVASTGEVLSAAKLAERLAKALALAKAIGAATKANCQTCCRRTVIISRSRSPESAKHIEDAQARGYPSVLTFDRAGASARRDASVAAYPIRRSEGLDRDEYPPATFLENGGVADVRYIKTSDNQSSGGQLRQQLRGAEEGCIVTLKTGP